MAKPNRLTPEQIGATFNLLLVMGNNTAHTLGCIRVLGQHIAALTADLAAAEAVAKAASDVDWFMGEGRDELDDDDSQLANAESALKTALAAWRARRAERERGR